MPFALVPTAADLLEDEHLAERAFFVEIEHPGGVKLRHPGAPLRMSETPLRSGPAPTLGQDNEAVLGEVGYNLRGPGHPARPGGDLGMAQLPLDGVRVLDLSHVFAGPTCTRILAELGADVIKVEARQRLDISRILIMTDNDTADQPWNRTCYFAVHNAGKRGITLDLTGEQGRDLLSRLIPHSDVLVESFTPRVMKAFELEYETVRQLKPDIIMLSMSGYGQTGPYRDWSAYGMGLEPASGISAATGYRGGPPIRTGMSFTDPLTGVLAAGAVLAALHYRQRTGRGQFIDLSQQEGAIALMGAALMDYQMNGRLPERMGNRSSWAAPQGCYRCRGDDDWLVISIENDEEWAAFCRASRPS